MTWNDRIGIGGAIAIFSIRSGTHDNSLASLLAVDFLSQSALKLNNQLRIIIINTK
jgi:hypothetical protein